VRIRIVDAELLAQRVEPHAIERCGFAFEGGAIVERQSVEHRVSRVRVEQFLKLIHAEQNFEEARLECPVVGEGHQGLLERQIEFLPPLDEMIDDLAGLGCVQLQILQVQLVDVGRLSFRPMVFNGLIVE
jgi:hypothetical protein